MSPASATDAASATASGITVSVSSVGDLEQRARPGACRRNAATSAARSTPITTARAQPRGVGRDEGVGVDALEQSARRSTPRCSNARSDASAACGFVAFESSIQRMPPATATVSMRCASSAELAERVVDHPDRRRRAARASADAARMFCTTCGAREPARLELVDGDDLERGGVALVEEGAIAEDALDDAEVARAGHVEAEPDRAARPPRPRPPRPCAWSPRRRGCTRTRPSCSRTPWPSRPGRPRASRASRGGRRRRSGTTLAHGCSAPGPVFGRWCSW